MNQTIETKPTMKEKRDAHIEWMQNRFAKNPQERDLISAVLNSVFSSGAVDGAKEMASVLRLS